MKGKLWTIPNIITLSRIPLVILFTVFLMQSRFITAVIFLIIAALTDFFDGFMARKLNKETELGELLDQIADKTSIFLIIFAIFYTFNLPPHIFLIYLRDILTIIFGGYLFIRNRFKIVFHSGLLGKSITALQFITLIFLFINEKIALLLIYIILLLTMILIIEYTPQFLKKIRKEK